MCCGAYHCGLVALVRLVAVLDHHAGLKQAGQEQIAQRDGLIARFLPPLGAHRDDGPRRALYLLLL